MLVCSVHTHTHKRKTKLSRVLLCASSYMKTWPGPPRNRKQRTGSVTSEEEDSSPSLTLQQAHTTGSFLNKIYKDTFFFCSSLMKRWNLQQFISTIIIFRVIPLREIIILLQMNSLSKVHLILFCILELCFLPNEKQITIFHWKPPSLLYQSLHLAYSPIHVY